MNQLVRTSLLLCSIMMGLVAIVPAQTVDVTKVLADPKTYTFSDNKHTVKTYIYETLEAQTTCCGPARMYLEVKIDPTGYVLNVKPLTGLDQDCYAKSVQDIVKNIKWNAKGFSAAKSIYFEIKPSIECSGDRSNAYAQVSIFNNEKVDANGVPLNYASSTGISASAAAGTSGTPAVPAGETAEPAKEAVAATTEPAKEAGTETADAGLPKPPGSSDKPARTMDNPTGGTSTGVPDKTRSSANAEMKSALAMAERDRERQEEEIKKLKDELAANKAKEEADKQRAEDEKRMAKEAEDAKRIAAEEARRRERDAEAERARRDRERDRNARANNDRNSRDRDRSRNGGGFQDQSYDDDRYADNRGGRDSEPPQRAQTPVERAQQAADEAKRAADEARRKVADVERDNRQRSSDLKRAKDDIIRAEERRLKAEGDLASAREREKQERLENERREADTKKRETERLVQEKMREMERMKSDLERAVADLERQEQELADKAAAKTQQDAEIQAAQAQRTAEMTAKIEQMRLENGGGEPGATAPGMENAFTGDGDVTKQLEILRQQILILTQQLRDLQGGGSSFSPSTGIATNSGVATRGVASRTAGPKSKFKSADQNREWERIKSTEDLFDPNRMEEYPQDAFVAVSEPASGQGGVAGSAGGNQHVNVAGPAFVKPVFAGGATAMKQFVADELKKASVCGLAHTAFEVTINGSGKVIAHNILSVSNQNLLLHMPAIIQRIEFQPTGSGLPVRAVYEVKADITCEGVEKVDLNNVPNMIRN